MSSESLVTADEFIEVLRDGMPSAAAMPFEIVTLARGLAVVRLVAGGEAVRPGGTVAGPLLFGFADLAMYAAVMTAVGKQPLAVTTDATIHFLRKPRPGVLVARARVLKHGQRLVVGDVVVTGEADDAPLVHVVMTYAVPPR